eukprot:12402268-Karenia_brevis.AAC.1
MQLPKTDTPSQKRVARNARGAFRVCVILLSLRIGFNAFEMQLPGTDTPSQKRTARTARGAFRVCLILLSLEIGFNS